MVLNKLFYKDSSMPFRDRWPLASLHTARAPTDAEANSDNSKN